MSVVFYVHFRDISQGWSINYGNDTCVCKCKRMGWEVMVLRDLFYNVGSECDVKGVGKGVNIALILARIEFNFFTVPCMVLYFGSVMKTVDKTEIFLLFLSSADIVKAFSASHTTLPVSRLGVHKLLGNTARTAAPS